MIHNKKHRLQEGQDDIYRPRGQSLIWHNKPYKNKIKKGKRGDEREREEKTERKNLCHKLESSSK